MGDPVTPLYAEQIAALGEYAELGIIILLTLGVLVAFIGGIHVARAVW